MARNAEHLAAYEEEFKEKGTVKQVYGNEAEEALFAWNGYAQVRPAK